MTKKKVVPAKKAVVAKKPTVKKEPAPVKKEPAPVKKEPAKHVTKRSVVFELAKQGLDINQIVAKTGQPKSSVHWLFSKFQLYKYLPEPKTIVPKVKEVVVPKVSKKEAKKFVPPTAKAKVKPVKVVKEPTGLNKPGFDADEPTNPFENE